MNVSCNWVGLLGSAQFGVVHSTRKVMKSVETAIPFAEADLDMFSMFGQTGAPTKRVPTQKDKKIFFLHFFATW